MMKKELDIPEAWLEMKPKRLAGTVLVVGANDTGKSTLVSYLVDQVCGSGKRAAWLDGDIGQSTLGLPGTQNLALLEKPQTNPSADETFFVGSTSPLGHMLPVLTGLAHLQKKALARGALTTIIDTSGLVALNRGGGALKQWTAELLRPSTIIALQRGDELDHLLTPWRRDERFCLHVLPVSDAVQKRGPDKRTAYRRRQFQRYFRKAVLQDISADAVAIYHNGKPRPGTLLALLDGQGRTLALGALQRFYSGRLSIMTPLPTVKAVRSLRGGALRIDPQSGEELS
ncbi:MAG TPA: Clp1/GlmU family protein [Desulfuromonadales bacterium]|nr:Clp1/GlmU family protein [Desulfuromonadales bacterium]